MPRTILEPRFQVEYLSILDSEGNLDAALDPKLPPGDLKALHRAMVLGRRLDERMVRLQRQGRIGTFAPIKGQEASQLGSFRSEERRVGQECRPRRGRCREHMSAWLCRTVRRR